MSTETRLTIASALLSRVQPMARLVASVLARVKPEALHGDNPHVSATDDEVLKTVSDVCASIRSRDPRSHTDDLFARRLAALIQGTPGVNGGATPDVLALTAQLLANPTFQQTSEIARFVVILALRHLYEIQWDGKSLDKLRRAYDELQIELSFGKRGHKKSNSYRDFLLDVLVIDGWLARQLDSDEWRLHCEAFNTHQLGISAGQRLGQSTEFLVLGQIPDFSSITNLVFAQPTGALGLDSVLGGLLPTISTGSKNRPDRGLVTLITGPPGSGKTSLCLTLTYRMAELGSVVRYVGTEESRDSLNAKRIAVVHSIISDFVLSAPSVEESDASESHHFRIVDATQEAVTTLDVLTTQLAREFETADQEKTTTAKRVHLPLRAVVAIDSLATLLQPAGTVNGQFSEEQARRALGETLERLRRLGVCLFLVCGPNDIGRFGLDFLADNILSLDVERQLADRHALRVLRLEKTRHQASHRGRHVFHISSQHGCLISPSLQSVLQNLEARPVIESTVDRKAVLFTREGASGPQLRLPDPAFRRVPDALWVRDKAQILLYGWGPSGKASLGMAMALQPRVSAQPDKRWREYLKTFQLSGPVDSEVSWYKRARILVVSFLHPPPYYERIAKSWFEQRHVASSTEARTWARERIDVAAFYPGYIDPETVVGRVRRMIHSARSEGRPYSGVVVDGVHNILVQLPLLESERLLWPTLYRILRSEGVNTVATFTFFWPAAREAAARKSPPAKLWPELRAGAGESNIGQLPLAEGARVFSNLLIASSDYTFEVELPDQGHSNRNRSYVHLATSVDGLPRASRAFLWDPGTLTYHYDADGGESRMD